VNSRFRVTSEEESQKVPEEEGSVFTPDLTSPFFRYEGRERGGDLNKRLPPPLSPII